MTNSYNKHIEAYQKYYSINYLQEQYDNYYQESISDPDVNLNDITGDIVVDLYRSSGPRHESELYCTF